MKKFNILKILFIILLISSSVKAEIVINSIGESIKLNSDGTWEKQTDNNILLRKGSKEIFFEFKFWINKAYLYKFSSVDSFNNEKKFKKLKTRCGGGGVMYNKRKSDVIISNFTMPLEFIGNKYEFTLITLPVLRTIIKENSALFISSSGYISLSSEKLLDVEFFTKILIKNSKKTFSNETL